MNVWTEHRNPEGRTYWFNTGTRESVWEKPDELKTPFERALNQTKWKEYFSGGRKYFYNTETKESKWDMPDELVLLLEKVEKEGPSATQNNALVTRATAPGPQGAANPLAGTDLSLSAGSQQTNGANGEHGSDTFALPLQSSVLPARPNLPDDPVIPHNGFATVEEGEKAFMHLLRKAGVDANWTWDQTMRSIITDPLYKALNTLAEKKAAWQKFTDALRAKEQEERDARLSKLRPAIRNMLKGNPNVFHYTTFATADKLFAQHPIWQQAKIEAERKLVFEEYVAELKQREMQESRAARARAINTVVGLFKRLEVDVLTKWRQAHSMVVESEEWQTDSELQSLPTLDILLAFEDYSRVREREFEEQMRRAQVEKTRKERKAREGFKALLKELVDDGKVKARTKWKQVYPLFSDDPRYLNMLGNPGSNPLELFWDVVDAMDQKLDAKINVLEGSFKRHNDKLTAAVANEAEEVKLFKITPETTLQEFLEVVKGDTNEIVQRLKTSELEETFNIMHEQAMKQQADEKRRAERRQRHLQDDLRYALKKMAEPVDINLSYEDAVPLMQDLPEFKALDDEEGRRAAFTKYVKRQKERQREKEREASEDGGSTTSRRRKEPERERDRDRERDKDRGDKEFRDKDRDVDRTDTRGSSSRHHRHDDHERHSASARDYRDRDRSRDYSSRDKDYYSKDGRDKEKDRDRDGYHKGSSRHHSTREYDRDRDRDDRRRGDRDRKTGRDWDDGFRDRDREDRERSTSVYREETGSSSREKRERTVYEDKPIDERSEKRARYEDESVPEGKPKDVITPKREETPEEGEI
ncbi:hypothetical protein BXZ70DRAFT_949059 [Cristinia sonorae]|uniref:Pre-mRNA-processing protein prp40 n=1 Tax=Cristinia sonorae TaxID=1940300 RepID=A0A8K0UIE0_9AGAR|nr:hypothetical protein BXZ70DRAFT_949059 [Cristinia sonorae]